jgi:hypothetical protein
VNGGQLHAFRIVDSHNLDRRSVRKMLLNNENHHRDRNDLVIQIPGIPIFLLNLVGADVQSALSTRFTIGLWFQFRSENADFIRLSNDR